MNGTSPLYQPHSQLPLLWSYLANDPLQLLASFLSWKMPFQALVLLLTYGGTPQLM